MRTIKFKTNINCGGCVAKVTPSLNKTVGDGNWQVDTTNRDKILSIVTELDDSAIVTSVQQAGFKIEKM